MVSERGLEPLCNIQITGIKGTFLLTLDLFDGNESVQQETLEFCYCSMIGQVFSEIFLHTKLDLIQFMLVIPKLLANTTEGIRICMLISFSHFDEKMSLSK